jgi:hypothetical protein
METALELVTEQNQNERQILKKISKLTTIMLFVRTPTMTAM